MLKYAFIRPSSFPATYGQLSPDQLEKCKTYSTPEAFGRQAERLCEGVKYKSFNLGMTAFVLVPEDRAEDCVRRISEGTGWITDPRNGPWKR